MVRFRIWFEKVWWQQKCDSRIYVTWLISNIKWVFLTIEWFTVIYTILYTVNGVMCSKNSHPNSVKRLHDWNCKNYLFVAKYCDSVQLYKIII